MRNAIPNALTASRIAAAAFLLLAPFGTPLFWALYAWCGISDMADGALARKLDAQSTLGARLDSLADLAFVLAGAYTLLPALPLPTWLIVWVYLIAACKAVGYASGLIMRGTFISLHTLANKAAGFALFVSIPALVVSGNPLLAIPACVIATFAAIQEGHLIRKEGSHEQLLS